MARVHPKVHGGRALLNLPGYESTAAIVAEVEDTSTWPKGKNRRGDEIKHTWNCHPEILVKLSDCSRAVTLEFDIGDPGAQVNALHKFDVMIEALQAARAGLAIEISRYNDRAEGLSDG